MKFIVNTLHSIIDNDKTYYQHHQERPSDGKLPKEDGGTIWLTPSEIARRALKTLEKKQVVEYASINTAPKDRRIVLSDGRRAEDGIWSDKPFPGWYHHVWNDGMATQGLPFQPTVWTEMPEALVNV